MLVSDWILYERQQGCPSELANSMNGRLVSDIFEVLLRHSMRIDSLREAVERNAVPTWRGLVERLRQERALMTLATVATNATDGSFHALNGCNGEATNTDDLASRNHHFVAPGQQVRRGPPPHARKNKKRGGGGKGGARPTPPARPAAAPAPAQAAPAPVPPSGGDPFADALGPVGGPDGGPPGQPDPVVRPHGLDLDPAWVEAMSAAWYTSKHPDVRTTFSFDEAMDRSQHFRFDCGGSPFCGLVCVDVALGRSRRFEEYLGLMISRNPADLGLDVRVATYASSRGANIRISVLRRGAFETAYEYLASPAWPTVNLLLIGGHYYLLCAKKASLTGAAPPRLRPGSWGLCRYVDFSDTYSGSTNVDHRSVLDRRDPIDAQDSYCIASVGWSFNLFGCEIIRFTCLEEQHEISVERFTAAFNEAQGCASIGVNPSKAAATVGSLRTVNTDPRRGTLIYNTAKVVKYAAETLDNTGGAPVAQTVGYSSTCWESVVSDDNLVAVAQSQSDGLVGLGTEWGAAINHFRHFKPNKPEPAPRPCVTTLLPVHTSRGQMGFGHRPRTTPRTVAVAFAVRSMTAKPKDHDELTRFIEFSKGFLLPFANATVVKHVEPDPLVAYASHNRGKKRQGDIDRVLAEYALWRAGAASKQFSRHSCFVKDEDSSKDTPSGVLCKPRLIMTMSGPMTIECCPVLDLIDAWNHSPFSKFQVKDMEPEEMMQRISEASDRNHVVTDYSSFESSIDSMVRKIELWLLLKLCAKAGYYNTARAIRKYAFGSRTLHFRGGTVKIGSRCSGDYWTSFGNGVVNVCIMAYCAHLRGYDLQRFRMLAEGDDGLVRSDVPIKEVITRLGFGYSTELSGVRPGDCDFLRSRWIRGKRYLNIGRVLKSTWLNKAAGLTLAKQKFLMRSVANSLHHLSPGHPVIFALVTRMLRDSDGAKRFKGWKRYLNQWGARDFTAISGDVYVDESMRNEIALGAGEFPPISIATQLALEETFLRDEHIYVGSLLDHLPEMHIYLGTRHKLEAREAPRQQNVGRLFRLLPS